MQVIGKVYKNCNKFKNVVNNKKAEIYKENYKIKN